MFDTIAIDHNILYNATQAQIYSLKGLLLDWLKSYITNRRQYVFQPNHKSEHMSVTCGVPQGSVLAPLFFLFMWIICLIASLLQMEFYLLMTPHFINHLEQVLKLINYRSTLRNVNICFFYKLSQYYKWKIQSNYKWQSNQKESTC